MNEKFFKNPNEEEYNEITEAVAANDGYCPCAVVKDENTKCICKKFKESNDTDFCHCGRFYKIKPYETVVLVKEIYNEEDLMFFDKWELILTKQDFIVIPIKYNSYDELYYESADFLNICRTKIAQADVVFFLDESEDSILEQWAKMINKKILYRSDLKK